MNVYHLVYDITFAAHDEDNAASDYAKPRVYQAKMFQSLNTLLLLSISACTEAIHKFLKILVPFNFELTGNLLYHHVCRLCDV